MVKSENDETMKRLYPILFLILIIFTMCNSPKDGTTVLIETSRGNITVLLYDDTPLHRDNFVKMVNNGQFDGKVFHRIIKEFMIQAGDIDRNPSDTIPVPENKLSDTIPAEIRLPRCYHKRGALAAARWDDWENPTKASSADQFYIVTGKKVFEFDLKEIEKQRFERLKQSVLAQLQSEGKDTLKALYKQGDKTAMAEYRNNMIVRSEKMANDRRAETLFGDEQKRVYTEIGGTPHLDGEYTVFGEVIDGMDVVAAIENEQTNSKDRPLKSVKIIKASVLK